MFGGNDLRAVSVDWDGGRLISPYTRPFSRAHGSAHESTVHHAVDAALVAALVATEQPTLDAAEHSTDNSAKCSTYHAA